MPTAKKPATKPAAPTLTSDFLAKSGYGNPEPGIRIACPTGTHYRALAAELHRLAAAVEMASVGVAAGRLVRTEDSRAATGHGRVFLEVASGDASEIKAAVGVLQAIIDAAKAVR